MKVVIIEDEHYTALDLENCIRELRPNFQVVKKLETVKDALSYFEKNSDYNLVFSDIQLGDGLSFEIYRTIQLSAPVIFCTAFDNYAIEAFKANGIDYLLKPVNKTQVLGAIEKYERLTKSQPEINEELQKLLSSFKNPAKEKTLSSLLVHKKDKIIPVKIQDIAVFYTQNEICKIIHLDGERYTINESLEKIEQIAGPQFFRANRQFLVNRKAVLEVIQHFSRKHLLKLSVNPGEEIVISKEKAPQLFKWLEEF